MPVGGVLIQAKPGLGSLCESNDPEAALPVSCHVMLCAVGLRLTWFALPV